MTQTCCICNEEFEGYGNNAEPYKKGICCDNCNDMVLAYRMNYQTPEFQEFDKRTRLVYEELDKKAEYYLKNLSEIEKSGNVLEILKAYCSIHTRHLSKDIIEDRTKMHDKMNKEPFLFEFVKMKSCQLPIFEISNNVMELMNTKNKIFKRNNPYDNFAVFFPKDSLFIEKTNISVLGFIINSQRLIGFLNKGDKFYEVYSFMKVIIYNPDEDDKLKLITLSIRKDDWSIEFERTELDNKEIYLFNKIFNKVMEIYVNFLDYLNHPQCVRTTYKFSENTASRMSKGKAPLNDIIKIEVGGNLLRIINLNKQHERTLKSAVLVRGFYRHFRNQNRYKRIYAMKEEELYRKEYFLRLDGNIAKWILPFKRGEGEIINKRRVLE